jgi:hypothetical protein
MDKLLPEPVSRSRPVVSIHIETSLSHLVEAFLSALQVCESTLIASIVVFEGRMPVPVLTVGVHVTCWRLGHGLSVVQMLQVIKCQDVKHRQEDPLETLLHHISLSLKLHYCDVRSAISGIKIKKPLLSAIPSSEEARDISPSHNLLSKSFVVANLRGSLYDLWNSAEAASQ